MWLLLFFDSVSDVFGSLTLTKQRSLICGRAGFAVLCLAFASASCRLATGRARSRSKLVPDTSKAPSFLHLMMMPSKPAGVRSSASSLQTGHSIAVRTFRKKLRLPYPHGIHRWRGKRGAMFKARFLTAENPAAGITLGSRGSLTDRRQQHCKPVQRANTLRGVRR
jgi:hypothetical protein